MPTKVMTKMYKIVILGWSKMSILGVKNANNLQNCHISVKNVHFGNQKYQNVQNCHIWGFKNVHFGSQIYINLQKNVFALMALKIIWGT